MYCWKSRTSVILASCTGATVLLQHSTPSMQGCDSSTAPQEHSRSCPEAVIAKRHLIGVHINISSRCSRAVGRIGGARTAFFMGWRQHHDAKILCVSTSKGLRAAWKQTAMANFSPTHARTPPPKGTQASGFTAAASGVPSMNRSGMNSSGTCNSARHHSLVV